MSTLIARLQPIALLPFKNPQFASTEAYQVAPSLTVARGTVMGQITSAGATQYMIAPYATGNSDGTQTPIGVAAVAW